MGTIAQRTIDKLSSNVKGAIGERITQVIYAAQGYIDKGKARVLTGTLTPKKKVAAEAWFDHKMENLFTGRVLTVESKFNLGDYTKNQKLARPLVKTFGGLIESRITSAQLASLLNSRVQSIVASISNVIRGRKRVKKMEF
jgi:hypothetical protein